MRKRLLALLAAACTLGLAAALLAGCAGGGNTPSPEGTDSGSTKERTALTVGFDQNFPPYGYVGDDGELTGFDLDLAKEVATRNGWEVVYKPISWDAKDLELSSGSIDCIWNGFTIEGREDGYTFSDPYMENRQVIVVKKDAGITKLADLKDKVVMAQIDSAALHLFDETKDGSQAELGKTFKKLQTVPEYNSAFMELEAGSVDAIAMDLPVAWFQTAGREGDFLILEDEPLSTEHYGIGFLKGNTELKDQVQTTLEEMVADGTAKTIAEKYADQGIAYDLWVLK